MSMLIDKNGKKGQDPKEKRKELYRRLVNKQRRQHSLNQEKHIENYCVQKECLKVNKKSKIYLNSFFRLYSYPNGFCPCGSQSKGIKRKYPHLSPIEITKFLLKLKINEKKPQTIILLSLFFVIIMINTLFDSQSTSQVLIRYRTNQNRH